MRLIDADRLKAVLEKNFGHTGGASVLEQLIDDQPTIQPQSTMGQLNDGSRSTAQSTDLIDRQAALDIFDDYNVSVENGELEAYSRDRKRLCELPTIQPVATDTNVGDTISKFIDGLEEIFADLRERHVDDSVCGLCEYDGAYMGQSGDWCNECPGFEKDDCFKLSDRIRKEWTEEIIKALPPAQPEPTDEQVEEYCKKRCLHVVTADFFESTKPQRLGHWVDGRCSECGGQAPFWVMASTYYESDFCPHCGAKMTISTK